MWSHLFSSVIFDEVVKLLVVYTFVKLALNGPPSSRVTSFLRYGLPLPIFQYFAKAFRIVVSSTCMHAFVASL
jgi:hypothetical protein